MRCARGCRVHPRPPCPGPHPHGARDRFSSRRCLRHRSFLRRTAAGRGGQRLLLRLPTDSPGLPERAPLPLLAYRLRPAGPFSTSTSLVAGTSLILPPPGGRSPGGGAPPSLPALSPFPGLAARDQRDPTKQVPPLTDPRTRSPVWNFSEAGRTWGQTAASSQSAHESPLKLPAGLGQRNKVTRNYRSQPSYHRFRGGNAKGPPREPTCTHRCTSRRARASNREFAEQWVQKARGGQQAWRPRGQEPRGALEAGGSRLRSERPRRARPRSLPATGAAAASAARWAGAAAAHWCGTTIGTSLRFCLQSNPSIKRGTKSPLITPCHKVICPGGKAWHRSARSVCVLERVRGAMLGGGRKGKGNSPNSFPGKTAWTSRVPPGQGNRG
ncbi:uncharacterized protein LOC123332259 [Bubalus bubalis]|uniref:uncharacterized protein LOC123332259 n=1 Tax=Bubalus bubalis TaxID=89462 RepID=UPI001E1B7306|nr:uncharacterized protein LOC123332259 [Bubalus bubalis]